MTLPRLLAGILHFGFVLARLVAAEPTAFEQRVAEANRLLDQGKLQEALVAVKAAAALDTNRFEAPFLAAVIFLELKAPEPARSALNSAVALAPVNQRPKLDALRQALAALEPPPAPAATAATPTNAPPQLTAAARRQYDTLALIIEEADKATLAEERKKLLREFLEKSDTFLKENPEQMPIWTLRAVAAIELNQAKAGWDAGTELKRLGAENSDDPKMRKVMASLNRKGWLLDQWSQVEQEEARTKASEAQKAKDALLRTMIGNFRHYEKKLTTGPRDYSINDDYLKCSEPGVYQMGGSYTVHTEELPDDVIHYHPIQARFAECDLERGTIIAAANNGDYYYLTMEGHDRIKVQWGKTMSGPDKGPNSEGHTYARQR